MLTSSSMKKMSKEDNEFELISVALYKTAYDTFIAQDTRINFNQKVDIIANTPEIRNIKNMIKCLNISMRFCIKAMDTL